MLGIQRAKLSLETNIIVVHERPLKLMLGNSLSDQPSFTTSKLGLAVLKTQLHSNSLSGQFITTF